MPLGDPSDPAVIATMLGATPGAVVVSHDGETTSGHPDKALRELLRDGGGGVLTAPASVVIAAGSLSGIGLVLDAGRWVARGLNEQIVVDGTPWYVSNLESTTPDGGEIRVHLSGEADA